jgi:branched-subunit amino acid ABC-type transport system permease component
MVAIMVMIALHIMLKYTRLGKAQRAVADSAELARISGVSAAKIVNLTWLIAGAVAGLGGFVLAATTGTFDSTLGFGFLLPTFAAVIIGGIGKPYGAMIGAVFIGVTMEVGALYIPPDYKQSLAFVLLILVLLIRPTGILGVVRQTSMGTA